MPVETEIIIRVDAWVGLIQRFQATGFSLLTPRAFESNVLYDTPERHARARTEILRIRGYAPKGETPVLRINARRESLTACGESLDSCAG